MPSPHRATTGRGRDSIDRTLKLDNDGSTQGLRMCADRAGLAPLLIVQAGPGLPLLHEVAKFQHHLRLENDFQVSYWEQRGCGPASLEDAQGVTLQRQVADLRTILRWLRNDTQQTVTVFGVSLGATIALQAVAHEPDTAKAIVAISPDAQTASSDASVSTFLLAESARPERRRLIGRLTQLGEPPYIEPTAFQLRARLLADLGAVERGKTFGVLLRETLFGMLRTYGVVGTVKAIRNMNLIQRRLLPELVSLDLIATPPRVSVPVHYVFGAQDPLVSAAIVTELPLALAAPQSTVILVPDAGHMVHFDQPEVVRSIAMKAKHA
jgi:proline iminopeptidase